MSKKETITIEVPVEWAEDVVNSREKGAHRMYEPVSYNLEGSVYSKCKQALDARMTPLEEWEEDLHLDYNVAYFAKALAERSLYPGLHDAKLMAASMQMLKALIEVIKPATENGYWDDRVKVAKAAIHAALPENVAKDVLDE
jgi:hypothetical protein